MVGKRGKLTSLPDRQEYIFWVDEAVKLGAKKESACDLIGLNKRTYQRWTKEQDIIADKRTTVIKPTPSHALTEEEKETMISCCLKDEFVNLPPSQIVPILADRGEYIASESSFYRVLRNRGLNKQRGRAKKRKKVALPTTHVAEQANEVWSWDITYLPTRVKGQYYYLYLIEDVFSRKGVGYEVHACEQGELAADLVAKTVVKERCLNKPLVLHSDNGSPMKSQTLLEKLYELGIIPSRGRPRVSNDNPFSESLFRTLKYCPQWPSEGFNSIDEARRWVNTFMDTYNNAHRHSQIRFVTPSERHAGKDVALLEKRKEVYEQAKKSNPKRWSGQTRNWTPIGAVTLNPGREIKDIKKAA